MPVIPIASFLAGSLLSLLLPVILLIALVVWYVRFLGRASEPADTSDLGRSGAEASGTGGAVAPADPPGPAAAAESPGGG
ncbi:MAG TPA: hypothetical protein VMP89_14485 [Solirubrobacteraceae bacterium]|nr:hypothetical protein [Solirubrobacteraceae bacterium]